VAASASPITAECTTALTSMPPRRRCARLLDSNSPLIIACLHVDA
jgi:hypothetical protein